MISSGGSENIVRRLILISLVAFSCSFAIAQRGFSGGHVGARFSGGFARQYGGFRGGYAAGPLFWDSLYYDDLYDSGYPVTAAPPIIVVQPPAARAADIPVASPVQPLLIELRGGRYVRVSDEQNLDDPAAEMQAGTQARTGANDRATESSVEPPSVTLVFRDGSREETSAYTIADGVLYAEATDYTGGSWNKKILLVSLDVPATVNANRAQGVRFRLPTAPNQVIVGP
jgi:hypothetical protein